MKQYLDGLTSALHNALGDSLRATWLTGSAAVGAYRDGHSDVDVLAAVDGADEAALKRVVASCAHEVLPCPATKLELVVYELDALRAPATRPRWSLNFDTGESEHHVGLDPGAEPSHWFVLDLAFARRHAKALVGPPAAELIGEVGDDAIEVAFGEMLDWFTSNEPEAVPVAHERAQHWLATGTFRPKPGLPSP